MPSDPSSPWGKKRTANVAFQNANVTVLSLEGWWALFFSLVLMYLRWDLEKQR